MRIEFKRHSSLGVSHGGSATEQNSRSGESDHRVEVFEEFGESGTYWELGGGLVLPEEQPRTNVFIIFIEEGILNNKDCVGIIENSFLGWWLLQSHGQPYD